MKEGRGLRGEGCGEFFFGEGNRRDIIPQLIQIELGGHLRVDQCPGRFQLRTNQICPGETGNHDPGQEEDQHPGETRRWTTQYDHTRGA